MSNSLPNFDRYFNINIKFKEDTIFKKVLDPFQYNYELFRKYKDDIKKNNKIWSYYNIRRDFPIRLSKKKEISYNEEKIYYEIPIFTKLDVKDIELILSYELHDIIRIMITNNLKILNNGKIIKNN